MEWNKKLLRLSGILGKHPTLLNSRISYSFEKATALSAAVVHGKKSTTNQKTCYLYDSKLLQIYKRTIMTDILILST